MKEPRIVLAGRPALSTPGARLACIISPLRDAAHAETEARIISAAETVNGAVPVSAPGWNWDPDINRFKCALAEALAAFVGEE